MGKGMVLIGIFLIFVYVYSFRKIKKTKEKTKNINSVQEFHKTYGHLMSGRQIQKDTSGHYRRYITKYNSSEDYREKL